MPNTVKKVQISSGTFDSLFAGIINIAHEAIIVTDEDQHIIVFNEGAERIFQYKSSEVMGQSLDILLPPFLSKLHSAHIRKFAETKETARDMNDRMEITGRRKDGSIFPAEASILKMREDGKMFFGAILQDITERREAEKKIIASANFANTILNSLSAEIAVVDAQGMILSVNDAWREFANQNNADENTHTPVGLNYLKVCEKAALSGDESAREALEGIRQVLSGATKHFTMEYTSHAADQPRWFVMRVLPLKDQSGRIIITHQDITPRRLSEQRLYETQRIAQIGSWELDLVTGRLYWSDEIYRIFEIDKTNCTPSYQMFLDLVHPEDREDVDQAYLRSVQMREPYEKTHRLLMRDGRIKFLHERGETFYASDGTPMRSVGMAQDITERKQAEEALLIKDKAMASSISAIALANLEGQLTYVNEAFLIMWGYSHASELLGKLAVSFWESEQQAGKVVQALIETGNWIGEMRGKKRDGTLFDVLLSASMVREPGVQPVMMASFLDITERKRAEKELQDREKNLREIVDAAPFGAQIYELFNGNLTLLQANQASNEILGADKSLYIGKTMDEVFPALIRTDLPFRFKHVAMHGGKYSISQFEYRDARMSGVFEFHAIQTTQDQVAVFFRDITELAKAYDETLVGWSRALEFRDSETDGHTQRVTDMTVRLARKMGIAEDKIKYIRWGALLHDMGKIAVPDKILLKPGKLTEEEWKIMRKHPVVAYEMLFPINFLRPALEIPYCHHEKWDGSGYPRGLKGIEIPLAARIFAVVDVWDALRSDRPYRPKWDEERVIEHIRQSHGTHFDPIVVDNFLEFLKERDC